MSWRYAHCGFSPLARQGVAFGPLAALPAMGYIATAATVASGAMSIIGAANQSAAQRAAGDIAYQNALQRNQVAQVQAIQLQQAAGQEQAASQRVAEDARRKGSVLASRARAVMAASGAGVDENLIASLEGEGNYNADVALYGGNEKARADMNQAKLTAWSGQAGVGTGAYERGANYSAADSTMIGAIGKTALSFASKYGGDAPSGGKTSTAAGDFTAPYGTGGLDDASMSRLA